MQFHQLTVHFRFRGIQLDLPGIQLRFTGTDLICQRLFSAFQLVLSAFQLILILLNLILRFFKLVADLTENSLIQLVDLILIQRHLKCLRDPAGSSNRSYALYTLQLRDNAVLNIGRHLCRLHILYADSRYHDRKHIRIDLHDHGGTHAIREARLRLIQFLLDLDHGGVHIRRLLIFQDHNGYTVP